ncbi:MAG: tripartite tricarboxylate transporter substrate binding protein, partial [Betaproteobacteria bacterium]|nr:tripartite tricarboxylate transporter substrate binding protein [Betaproteobacteria bacterium]
SIAINPSLYPKLPYDPARDFAPVTLIAAAPYLLLVPPAVPARTVRELVALAKSKPGQLNYASTGSGSLPHLAMELFKSMAGVDIVHVAYRGIGPAVVDLLSGQAQVMFLGMVSSQAQVKAGKLHAIAITGAKRSRVMPDLATVAESGLPGFDVTGWYGVFVPQGTPAAIIARLQTQIATILRMPDVGSRLASDGADVGGDSPAKFAAFVKSESAKWAKVVKISGVRAN